MSAENQNVHLYKSLCEELAIGEFNTSYGELAEGYRAMVHEVVCEGMLRMVNEYVADSLEIIKSGKGSI